MRLVAVEQDAVGVIALGQGATGVLAVGQSALGIVAVGQLARGGIAVGQLALGLVAFGQLAAGLLWGGGMLSVAATRGPAIIGYAPFGRVRLRARVWERRMPRSPVAWAVALVALGTVAALVTLVVVMPWGAAAFDSDGIFRQPPAPLR